MPRSNDDMEELFRAASDARENAYAPYSGYRVGAAVQAEDGRIWSGANVENISFGATICAERAAIARMVCEGIQSLCRIAIVTEDGGSPCGICLQVLREFSSEPNVVDVLTMDESGAHRAWKLSELLPFAFRTQKVSRTESSH